MRVVAKIGTSSLTDERGVIDAGVIDGICDQLAELRAAGHEVVLVSSGAVAAGVAALRLPTRPSDTATLQALAAAGQSRLMEQYNRSLDAHGLVAAQVLLVPNDFVDRRQYLFARSTLTRLLELGCIPIVNENDAIASHEIRFGDNDRIAALVAHNINAELLVLLTDMAGLYTADPRHDPSATLIEEVQAGDPLLEVNASTPGSVRGSGGMTSKLSAARMASWSGVRAVVASATRPAVLVDDGATRALVERGRSLLPAGVTGVSGDFAEGDVIDVRNPAGVTVARGMALNDAGIIRQVAGKRTTELPGDVVHEVIHRDDLVVLV
ncbi:MAG: glutamate 5-kinase [Ilumatobacteraceae bacterium]